METSMASTLSSERTVARREDGGKAGSQELQERRSDTFMTPMPGDEAPPAGKDSPAEGEEIPKCKLAFEEVVPPCCVCVCVCVLHPVRFVCAGCGLTAVPQQEQRESERQGEADRLEAPAPKYVCAGCPRAHTPAHAGRTRAACPPASRVARACERCAAHDECGRRHAPRPATP